MENTPKACLSLFRVEVYIYPNRRGALSIECHLALVGGGIFAGFKRLTAGSPITVFLDAEPESTTALVD